MRRKFTNFLAEKEEEAQLLDAFVLLKQVFGYLDGVKGGSFANLVSGEPEGDSVVVGQVLAHAAHINVILAGRCPRRNAGGRPSELCVPYAAGIGRQG